MNPIRIALACLALAPLAAAGEDQGAFVWTGKQGMFTRAPRVSVVTTSYGKGGPSEVRRIPPDAHATKLMAELAELRTAEATDGPSEALDAARLELWIRACDGEPFEGQGELLVELALERAERLALRGAGDAALEATRELLLPGRIVEDAGEFELAPADAAWLERAAAWLADPRLVALRAKLAPAAQAPVVSGDVEAVITRHLYDGNRGAVLQFGMRAVPVTEGYVAAHLTDYPAQGNLDPLTILFELDEERGARFALQHLDDSGDVFPLRVLRSMREASVLENDGTWAYRQHQRDGSWYHRAELLQPIWRDVLERLVARPDLASDAFREVGLLVRLDALSPSLGGELERALRGEDPTAFQKAMLALENAGGRETARALLGRLLDHPLDHVRALAAQRLNDFDEAPELWPMASDPDVSVRAAVVEGLRPRRERLIDTQHLQSVRASHTNTVTLRGLDRGGMRALETLLGDAEAVVYLEALDILVDNPTLIASADTVRALTDHGDARVRRRLPSIRVGDLPDPIVLQRLAADADADVRQEVDLALGRVASVGPNPANSQVQPGWTAFHGASTPWSDAYLPALVARLESAGTMNGALSGAAFLAGLTEVGARELVRLARRTDSDDLRARLIDRLAHDERWARSLRGFHFVEPAQARDLLAHAWRRTPDRKAWERVQEALIGAPAAYRTAGLEWSSAAELPWSLRLLGLRVSAPVADEAWGARLQRLLASTPELAADARNWGGPLFNLGQWFNDPDLAARLMADLVASDDVDDELLSFVLDGLALHTEPDAATAERVIERWADAGGRFERIVMGSLRHIAPDEERPRVELFERVLRVDNNEYPAAALVAMGRLHLRAHLPLLERTLAGELGADAELRISNQVGAARALACYLDDEAAELLLRGVGTTPHAMVRDACFEALDTIRRYQDERARWTTRSDSKQARAEAIAELVGLIEAGEGVQRVEAVRALGTLGAVEELPRLVRLTAASDAQVAAAAKEALDLIRATQGRGGDGD